jgi:predicted HTH domain antitoxin
MREVDLPWDSDAVTIGRENKMSIALPGKTLHATLMPTTESKQEIAILLFQREKRTRL